MLTLRQASELLGISHSHCRYLVRRWGLGTMVEDEAGRPLRLVSSDDIERLRRRPYQFPHHWTKSIRLKRVGRTIVLDE